MSPEHSLVRLIVEPTVPFTWVFVIDGSLAVAHGANNRDRAMGQGRVEVELPPGIYRIKYKLGDYTTSEMIELDGSEPTVICGADAQLPIRTAFTNFGFSNSYEFHTYPALQMATSSVICKQYDGPNPAELFIFVRDSQEHEIKAFNPAKGLTLLNELDEVVCELGNKAHWEPAGYSGRLPWAGMTLNLRPGWYRLRANAGRHGAEEMGLQITAGNQTQVFMERRLTGKTLKSLRADLANASIRVNYRGRGFEPNQKDDVTSELARMTLSMSFHPLRDRQIMQELLSGKFRDPMLGIFAAHLLLRDTEPDRDLLNTVIHNAEAMLGEHPDLDAARMGIELRYGSESALFNKVFTVPPMLTSSWEILAQASYRNENIIQPDSLASRIGTGARLRSSWLTWDSRMVERPKQKIFWTESEYSALRTHRTVALPPQGPPRERSTRSNISFDSADRAMLRCLVTDFVSDIEQSADASADLVSAAYSALQKRGGVEELLANGSLKERLFASTGLPAPTVDLRLRKLSKKLSALEGA